MDEAAQGGEVTRAPEDAAAFCASEYPKLVGGLALDTGDRFVAEELAQEALLRACQRWERVSRLDSPAAWTWHVAMNLARSHFRRRQAEWRARRRLAGRPGPGSPEPAVSRDPRVAEAVAALPHRQRVALVLCHYLDLSVVETANRMGISEDAVRSLTKRATSRLREELDTTRTLEHRDG